MGFLSFLKRGEANDSGDRGGDRAERGRAGDGARGRARGGAEAVDDVQQLRLRARRRLIGAAVLVGVAVIVFPLLFETQPRPIPVDLPIDIPRKDGATPLTIPAPTAPTSRGQTAGADAGRGIITESAEQAAADRPVPPPEAPRDPVADQVAQAMPPTRMDTKPDERATIAEPARPARVEPKPEHKPEVRPETKPERKPEPKVDAKPERKPDPKPDTRSADAARAQALLEGRPSSERKPDAAASAARFIVQVGAYADGKAAQDVRVKVERMGLKTYTQAVDTADGKRIRVRVGPFNSRDEADKVAAKVRGGGLSSAVLTL
ncbi:SPOR domain-containing protein [Roseateles sp. UC29_93]|uniref:SPOR domain-containing protein n=1 Tax=Roseateles sp. UC29_93 TaxID=3350177 RepID=UPI003672C834